MTASTFDQLNWEKALLLESKRDLVFVFNIAAGAFGGPKPPPTRDEIPALLQRVASSLLAGGCVVGFGDSNTNEFSVPEQLQVPIEHLAESVVRFYVNDQENANFLAFSHRVGAGSERDA